MRSTRRAPWSVALGLVLATATGGCTASHDDDVTADDAPRTAIVLVTFDGVRPLDLFGDPDLVNDDARAPGPGAAMPYFVDELGPTGAFLGRPGVGEPMRLANPIGVSLPGYQSLVTGRATFCFSNECGPPRGETLFARVRGAFAGPQGRIVMRASWPGLCDGIAAAESADAICGPEALRARWLEERGGSSAPDAVAPPASVDEMAFDLVRSHLREPLPAILYLALDESDGTGHADDRAAHLATLARYDDWLRVLVRAIDALSEAGQPVALFVTTDHGRGSGDTWHEHRWNVPGTQDVWLFARGPGIRAGGAIAARQRHTLADVRPTIEHLMGLAPRAGPFRGEVIDELLGGPPR